MSALLQLPTAEELLAVDDFDAVLAVFCEVVAAERDLGRLHGFVESVETQAEVFRRLRREVDDAGRASAALDRVAAWASLCLGKRLGELDGGGRGKPRSKRTEVCEGLDIDTDHARRLVQLGELGDAQVLELVDTLEASGRRPSPWALVEAAKKGEGELRDGDESYTPERFIRATEKVFGQRPDEDIASCPVAQQTVGAKRFWSKAKPKRGPAEVAAGISEAMLELLLERWGGAGDIYDADGVVLVEDETIVDLKKRRRAFAAKANKGRLSHAGKLEGKVWGNPPFAFPRGFIVAVVLAHLGLDPDTPDEVLAAALKGKPEGRALLEALESPEGPVTEAILLVNVGTSTTAQQLALLASSAQCWVTERINFNDATGEPIGSANRFEQVFFYFGSDPERFAEVFREFGRITFTRRPKT